MQQEVYLGPLLVHTQSVAECGLKGGRPKRCHSGNVEGIRAVEGVTYYSMCDKADGTILRMLAGQRELNYLTGGEV
jgi:hypothetical protein